MRKLKAALFGGVIPCLWAGAIAVGFALLIRYEMTPGDLGAFAQQLPADVPIIAQGNRPTIVMFAHPRCPCTRASLEELAKITARSDASLAIYIVFFQPGSVSDSWSHTDLWESAKHIPDSHLLIDEDGRLSQAFGARTSGHVFVYDESGGLRYQGGITPTRGHAGDSYGKSAILSFLSSGSPTRASAPVFGCPLNEHDPTSKNNS